MNPGGYCPSELCFAVCSCGHVLGPVASNVSSGWITSDVINGVRLLSHQPPRGGTAVVVKHPVWIGVGRVIGQGG